MAKKKSRRRKAKPEKRPALDLNRVLDVLGIGLVALGGITVLSFLSTTQGTLTGWWLHVLRQGFGWGVYVVPLGMMAVGLWLLIRHFETRPAIGWERATGAVLLFLVSLTIFHFLAFSDTPWELAHAGGGGGYLGAALCYLLEMGLGTWGAGVVLLALWLIGLSLVLSTPPVEMVRWGQSRIQRLREHLQARRRPVINGRREPTPSPAPSSPRPAPAPAPRPVGPAFPRIIGGPQEWRLPRLEDILEESVENEISQAEIRHRVRVIEETLASFGVPARVVEVNQGPVVTQFGVEPGYIEGRGGKRTKVKVSKILALADDLALALAAAPIRIEAPVPGRSIVGIEVPNSEISLVALRGVMESEEFRSLGSKLALALGRDVSGQPVVADLAVMPHLLIAGTTGSGKSVCINSIVTCLLLNNTPDELRMIMVDPKRVELTIYNGLPHLLAPVVVDLERVVGTLQWAVREMEQRYQRLAKVGARHIDDYNQRVSASGEKPMPYIIIVIDELADLMMLAPDEVERTVCRLAQMARATGIHLVIATQRPSVDVVTGLIKANFPARISFAVTSQVDSRVILDMGGAERLLGRGDMLFLSPDASQPVRLQGCFVSDQEVVRLVQYWKGARVSRVEAPERAAAPQTYIQQPLWEEMRRRVEEARREQEDELLEKAIEVVRQYRRASISLLQRRLRIGYTRAARLIDTLEERGIVGPPEPGTRVRPVLLRDNEEYGGGQGFESLKH